MAGALAGVVLLTVSMLVSPATPAGAAGTTWRSVFLPGSTAHTVTCASDTQCFALDENGTTLASFDGSRFTGVALTLPTGQYLSDISCVSATRCYAAGSGGGPANDLPVVFAYDGTSWSPVTLPGLAAGVLSAISCTPTTCVAVGYETLTYALELNVATNAWTAIPPLNPAAASGASDQLFSVWCTSSPSVDCIAAGYTRPTPSGGEQNLIEQWNGTSWSVMPVADPYTVNTLQGVSCITVTECFAVGSGETLGSFSGSTMYSWNGASWSSVAGGTTQNAGFQAISCQAQCEAVGSLVVGTSSSSSRNPYAVTVAAPSSTLVDTVPASTTTNSSLNGVACTVSAGCIAVGADGALPLALGTGPGPYPPGVNDVTPSSATPGTSVAIDGAGFTGVTAVDFGSTPASSFSVTSDRVVTAVVPPGSGTVDVTVTAASGTTESGQTADQFTYPATPVVGAVSPATGVEAGGQTVTVTGTGFTGATSVDFGSTPIPSTSFTSVTDTAIVVTSPPASAAGAVDVRVVGPAGTSPVSVLDRFTYTSSNPLAISGISPTSDTDNGGGTVVITGTGFTGAQSVAFTSHPVNPAACLDNACPPVPATSFTVDSDTRISAVLPAVSSDGPYDVTVGMAATTNTVTDASAFTFVPATPPQVTGVSPATGADTGGTAITITGSGFSGTTGVDVSGTTGPDFGQATSIEVVSDTRITAVTPPGASSAIADVIVTTPLGSSPLTTADRFAYGAGVPPVVTGLSVTTGSTNGGMPIVIHGSGFTGASAVGFGTVPATPFTVVSDTEIDTTVPQWGGNSPVDVQVTTPGGTSAVTGADQFTYQQPVAPTSTFTSSPSTWVVGVPITFTFALSPDLPGDPIPTGTVGFAVDNGAITYVPVGKDGKATFVHTFTAASSLAQIYAGYSGDGFYSSGVAGSGQPVVTASPDLTPSVSHTDPFTAGSTGVYHVKVDNVGSAPTTGTVTVGATLPTGVTYQSATAGWTCSASPVDPTQLTCTDPATIAAGANLALDVTVAVASTSTGGTDAWTVATDGDTNPANDSTSEQTSVAAPTSPQVAVRFTGPHTVVAGGHVTMGLSIQDTSSTPLAAGTVVDAVVPDGNPVGQVLTATASGSGWHCSSYSVAGRTIVRCVLPVPIAAGASAGVSLVLTAPSTAAGAHDTLVFAITGPGGVLAPRTSWNLVVTAPAAPVLSVGLTGPSMLSTSPGRYVVQVADPGSAATGGDARVALVAPAGVSVASAVGSGWACQTSPGSLTCTSTAPLPAGGSAAPLAVGLVARPSTQASVTLSVQASDTVGSETASASLSAALPQVTAPNVISTFTAPAVGASGTVTVRNTGTTATGSGPLTVVQTLPAGLVATVTGVGWSCQQASTVLTCTVTTPSGTLAGGASGPPATESFVSAAGQLGGTVAVSTQTAFITPSGTPLHSGSVGTTLSLPTLLPASLSTTLSSSTSPVPAGGSTSISLDVRNSGYGATTGPVTVAIVLPAGTTTPSPPATTPLFTVPTAGQLLTSKHFLGSTAAFSCAPPTGAGVLVCVDTGAIAAQSSATITVPVTFPTSASGGEMFTGGTLATAGCTTYSGCVAMGDTDLAGGGASALGNVATLTVPITGLSADAGADQTVGGATAGPDGTSIPSVITLDGRGSGDPGSAVTYGWVQTAGPAVTWAASAPGAAPGGGSSLPTYPTGTPQASLVAKIGAYGTQPTFTLPLVDQTTVQTLTFELLLTDGAQIRTATTTVTVRPPPSPPPTAPPLCFRPLPTGSTTLAQTPCLAAGVVPSAESLLVVGPSDTTTATHDAAGHGLLYSWSVADPAGLKLIEGTYGSAGAGGEYHLMVWPPGVSQLSMTASITNGQLDGQGHKEIVADPVSLGTAPPPLSVSVVPPAGPVAAGSTVHLSATVANGTVAGQGTVLTWTQTGGPTVTGQTSSGTGLSFTAPAPTTQSATVTFSVTGLRGTGAGATAAEATVTVALVAAAPLALSVTGGQLQAAAGGTVGFSVAATGGRSSTYTYSGSVGSGGGSVANTGGSFTYTAGPAAGLADLTVTVTDGAAESTSVTVPVTVGTPSTSGGAGCSSTGLLAQAIAALSGGKDPTFTVASFTFDLGTAETSPAAGSCGTGVTSLTFDSARSTMGPFVLSHAKVTISTTDLTVSSGTLAAPAGWGLGSATVTTPIDVSLAAATVSGAFTWTGGFPFLGSGGIVTNATAMLSLSGAEVLTLSAQGTVAGGVAKVDATVPLSGSGFSVTASLNGAKAIGLTASGNGSLDVTSSGVTGSVVLQLSAAAPVVLAGDLYLSSSGATLTWSPSGLTVAATAWVGGADGTHGGIAQVTLAGAFVDTDNWSLTASLTHMTLPSWLPNVSLSGGSSVTGSVTDAGGTITFDVTADLTGSWAVGPTVSGSTHLIDVTGLRAELSNATPPTSCGALTGVWLAVSGTASVQLPVAGAPAATLTAEACAAPGSDVFSLVSTANLAHWAPIPGVPVTLDSASLNLQYDNGAVSFTVGATASVKGVQGNAVLSLLPGGGLLVGVSMPNLSGLGVPLPAGAVVFSTQAIQDLSTVTGLPSALGVSTAALSGLGVAQDGLLAMADFQVPTSLTSVLTSANLPAPTDLTMSVDLGSSGVPVITGKLAFGAGGYTIFSSCPTGAPGCNPTKLALASVNLQISLAGAFGLGATAAITLPTPGASATASSTIDLTAEVTVDLVQQSITASFYTTGNLVNAFGINGLTLGNLAIQGGIVFNPPPAPPTPSIGFAATIQTIPCSWAATIGDHESGCTGSTGTPVLDANAEPMTLAVNISEKAPVFALQIGVPNNNPVLQFGSALTVDDASLVIAPLGGQIGNYSYPIGFSLRFDGQVMGTSVAVQAAVNPLAASISAKVQMGTVDVGIVTLDKTEFDFSVDPVNGINLSFTGGLDLGSDGTLTATASATASPSGIVSGQLPSFSLEASAANLSFANALTVNQFNLTASGQLGSSSAPVPQLQLAASGQASLLGHTMALSGGIDLTPGLGVTGASLFANPGPISFGPGGASISGPGCASIPLLAFTGPCVGASFDPVSSDPLTVTLDGTASANGITATFDGTYGDTGLTLTNASVTLGSPSDTIDATVAVSGNIYFGTKLSGTTAKDPAGNAVQVQQGDFDLTGSSQVSVAGIDVGIDLNVGHLGSDIFASGSATVTALGAHATLSGSFADTGGNLQYSLSASAGFPVLDGFQLSNASLTLSNATGGSLQIAGTLEAGGVITANLMGSYTAGTGGGATFDVSGTGSATIAGVAVGGSVDINDQGSGVSASVSLNGNWDNAVSFVATTSFDTNGNFCANGSATVGVVSGSASYCTPDPRSSDPDVIALSFTYGGVTATGSAGGEGWDVSIGTQNPGSFDLPGSAGPLSGEVSANWSWSLDVNELSGVTLSAQGSATAKGCISYLVGSTCSSVGATLTGSIATDGSSKVCASGNVANTTIEVCADDTGVRFTQPSSLASL